MLHLDMLLKNVFKHVVNKVVYLVVHHFKLIAVHRHFATMPYKRIEGEICIC
jgi:hypothetical protein